MHTPPKLLDTLHTLHLLWPAQGVLHVGAGLPGADTWYHQLPLSEDARIDCIEADPQRYARLALAAEPHPQMRIHRALLGSTSEPGTFHLHSNGNESSSLPAHALSVFWRNNAAVESIPMQQDTLDAWVGQHLPQAEQANWLHIDCLPAAAIAEGACKVLQHTDIILARVVVEPLPPSHALAKCGATLAELSGYLQESGFTLNSTHEERHPAFATALYTRDHRAAHWQSAQRYIGELKAKADLQAQLAQAQADHADLLKKQGLQAKAQQALQADLTKQTQARQAAEQARAELQAQLTQAQTDHADLIKKQELQAQFQQALQADLTKQIQANQAVEQARAELQEKYEKLQAGGSRTQCEQGKPTGLAVTRAAASLDVSGANRLIRGVELTEQSKARWPYFLKIEELQVCVFLQWVLEAKPSIVLDIGANVGFYALITQKYFPAIRCVAFEPTPDSYQNLVENAKRNQTVGGLEVKSIALSSRSRDVDFSDFGNCSGKNGITSTSFHDQMEVKSHLTVEADALDNVLNLAGQRIIIKIDVEGHECEVLKGARKTLISNEVILQIETGHKGDRVPLNTLIQNLGLRLIYQLGPDSYYTNLPEFTNPERTQRILDRAGDFMIMHRWDIERDLS